jgi:hypothetical protein
MPSGHWGRRGRDELEDLGIDHGRDRDGDSANKQPTRAELGLEKDPETRKEKLRRVLLESKLQD